MKGCFPVVISCYSSCVCIVYSRLSLTRTEKQINIMLKGALLAVLIVAYPDHLLYHPPAYASEVEDRLFGGFYRYHCDQSNSQKGSTVTVSWLKFVTNAGMLGLHINNPLTLIMAPLAPHRVLLVGLFSNR